MSEPNFIIKRGDTASPLSILCEDSSGDQIDVLNATAQFKMRPIEGGDLTVDDAAINSQNGDGSDGSLGAFLYVWGNTSTFTPGFYVAEFEVTFPTGDIQTFPNGDFITVYVKEDLR